MLVHSNPLLNMSSQTKSLNFLMVLKCLDGVNLMDPCGLAKTSSSSEF